MITAAEILGTVKVQPKPTERIRSCSLCHRIFTSRAQWSHGRVFFPRRCSRCLYRVRKLQEDYKAKLIARQKKYVSRTKIQIKLAKQALERYHKRMKDPAQRALIAAQARAAYHRRKSVRARDNGVIRSA